MMNYSRPYLGQTDELFDFMKPKPKGESVFDIFTPKESKPKSSDFYDFFKPAQKRKEKGSLPAGGDPFSAAAPASRFRSRSRDEWKPYPRMREGYRAPMVMSGPGFQARTPLLSNPAFWLIAGVGVLIALEMNGVTNLSSNA